MRERTTTPGQLPSRTQEMSVEVAGRTWGICGDGQMEALREMMLHKVMADAADSGETLDEAETRRRVEAEVKASGWATPAMVMDMMTPPEREQWAAQYRFGGFWGKRGSR
jgi:hypothetical protein